MQEEMFALLLIIWSQALAYCFCFWQVGVVIITILRASVLSADEKAKISFIPGFTLTFLLSKGQNFRCFGVIPGGVFADLKSVHN